MTSATNMGGARTRSLTREFGNRTILDDIDLDIAPGEFVVLLGKSGSGKSTLLRALAGLDHDVAGHGQVTVPESAAVIFQDARLLPWQRVLNNVRLGLTSPDATVQARAALEEVGLGGRERAWPRELSGGEQQRVALARALVRQPGIILADEPFGALDALTRIAMHELLLSLVERHRPAVLLVTHDVDEAVLLADRAIVLDDGRFTLDLKIGLPRRGRRTQPEFLVHREELLDALGVHSTIESSTNTPSEKDVSIE
jgi:sulfonate transport system ATP-binding protein